MPEIDLDSVEKLLDIALPGEFDPFGDCDFVESPHKIIVYPEQPISKADRVKLKSLGWRLQRHSRTKKEIWVFRKPVANPVPNR